MSTITTINSTDKIADSRSTINNNFSNLNTDKEEKSNKVTAFSTPTDTQYPSAKLVSDQLAGKQASGSYEVTSNKETSALDTSTSKYPCNNVVKSAVDGKISTYGSQTAKYFLAAPNATDGTPSFRAMSASDVPALSYEASGAVSSHAGLTTGVHGVGAGTVAKTSDITATKLDDFATPDANTDLNANTTNHGLLLQATAPAAGLTNVVAIENGETVYKNKALYDATAPSTQAFGDAAAVGTAVTAARRDHKHAMPATTKDTTAITGVLKGNGSAISACSNLTDVAIPVKAAGSDITTGTDDAKFATAKALLDANILTQAWTSWTPTFTNLTVGNGTLASYYTRIGKTIIAKMSLTLGSGSSVGTQPYFTLPVTSVSQIVASIGTGTLADAGTSYYQGIPLWVSTTTCYIYFVSTSGNAYTQVTATTPFTWTTGDMIFLELIYEAA